MSNWRAAGLTYLRFSNIAASAVRKIIKPDGKVKVDPMRETATIQVSGPKKAVTQWW